MLKLQYNAKGGGGECIKKKCLKKNCTKKKKLKEKKNYICAIK
jgi:hypothetical protein